MSSESRLYAAVLNAEICGALTVQMVQQMGIDGAAKISEFDLLYSARKDLKYTRTSLEPEPRLVAALQKKKINEKI